MKIIENLAILALNISSVYCACDIKKKGFETNKLIQDMLDKHNELRNKV